MCSDAQAWMWAQRQTAMRMTDMRTQTEMWTFTDHGSRYRCGHGRDVAMPWIQMWIQIKTRAGGSRRTALVWSEGRDGIPDQTTVRSGSKGECGQLKKKKKKCMDLDRSYIWVGGEKFSGREKPVSGFESWKEQDHSRKPV